MDYDQTLKILLEFVEKHVLAGAGQTGSEPGLTAQTPLLEWGVLNSLRLTQLLGFIRDELQVDVSPELIVGRNFRDLDAITRLVISLHDDPARV
ncbi:hypothetical protein C7C45_11230 [Micromonospora arborensis]|uniref:Carrier domain-containing protein n=1 Tax=Micromonospora arborensis TaxID=2116518 RepID=A0A318NM51_9ACTN|nr:phosphopantetheine-binding protein [Micromonospora arborensis]PYC71595.1 hypothetical protein C7C45_11230 [Micromonospora arborensis]